MKTICKYRFTAANVFVVTLVPTSASISLSRDKSHYCDVIMGVIASQITSLTIVNSTVYADADQRKHESSASLAFAWGIHRGPVNSPHKWAVTRKMLPFYDVITRSCPQNCKSVLGGCWQAINKEGICLCVVNVVSGFLICSRDMNKFRITYKILRPPLTVFLLLSFQKKVVSLTF